MDKVHETPTIWTNYFDRFIQETKVSPFQMAKRNQEFQFGRIFQILFRKFLFGIWLKCV